MSQEAIGIKLQIIVVDGVPHEWPKAEISYDQVVELEFPDFRQHPEYTYSVTYKNGPSQNPEGILLAGHSVYVKNDMIFRVSRANQS